MPTNPFFALVAAVALAASAAQAAVETPQQDQATTNQSLIAFELPTDGTLSDTDSDTTSINFACAVS